MEITADYDLIEIVKNRLTGVQDILLSTHAFDRLRDRPITEEQLKDALHNPVNLMHAEIQNDRIGTKYKLIIRKSGKYDLLIVVRFVNSHLKIITARIQNKKRIRITEKWRRRLRVRR